MDYKLIATYEEFDILGAEWNALLDESASHVPFLRHEYLMSWWQTRGGGEWPEDSSLAVVTACQNGRMMGAAPLFRARNREGLPALMLIGSVEVSDYLDVLARPEDTPAFLNGLLPFLAECVPGWQVLDWYNILDDSPTLPALKQAAEAQGWAYEQEQLQHSPYIKLPGDWEAYLASIDKKQRHEIRRKMRRAHEATPPATWYIVDDPAKIGEEAEDFIQLMEQDPEKKVFLTPPMRAHMLKVMRCAFEEGCLQLAFLEVEGKKAAGYLSFDYLNRLWVYNSGLDRSFMEYSPGWVLLGDLLQYANEKKYEEFDFMRGDEEYKYRFGAIDRFVVRAAVRR